MSIFVCWNLRSSYCEWVFYFLMICHGCYLALWSTCEEETTKRKYIILAQYPAKSSRQLHSSTWFCCKPGMPSNHSEEMSSTYIGVRIQLNGPKVELTKRSIGSRDQQNRRKTPPTKNVDAVRRWFVFQWFLVIFCIEMSEIYACIKTSFSWEAIPCKTNNEHSSGFRVVLSRGQGTSWVMTFNAPSPWFQRTRIGKIRGVYDRCRWRDSRNANSLLHVTNKRAMGLLVGWNQSRTSQNRANKS